MIYELSAINDCRASFYKKAMVEVNNDTKTLTSYSTKVAEIVGNTCKVFGTYSATTLRHIKEFLLQNGFNADTKAQIEKDYMWGIKWAKKT